MAHYALESSRASAATRENEREQTTKSSAQSRQQRNRTPLPPDKLCTGYYCIVWQPVLQTGMEPQLDRRCDTGRGKRGSAGFLVKQIPLCCSSLKVESCLMEGAGGKIISIKGGKKERKKKKRLVRTQSAASLVTLRSGFF